MSRSEWPIIGKLPIMPAKCENCPFQTNGKAIALRPGRVREIKTDIMKGFMHICHKTGHDADTPDRSCWGAVDYMADHGIRTESDRVQAIVNDLNRGGRR
jgi:hypothetical protein